MAWYQFTVTKSSRNSPQSNIVGTETVPAVMIDDQTGHIYVGGVDKTATWTPSGGSGLVLVTPQPTADPRVFTLPSVPALLLLFVGGVLQSAGAGNDFMLSGTQITMNYTPVGGASVQVVVG